MIKNVLGNIEGVALYPVISLLIFFVFFIAMLVYVIRQKRSHMDKMSSLPLDDDKDHTRSL